LPSPLFIKAFLRTNVIFLLNFKILWKKKVRFCKIFTAEKVKKIFLVSNPLLYLHILKVISNQNLL